MRRLIPLMAVMVGLVIGCQQPPAPPVQQVVETPVAKPETPAEYAQRLRLRAHEIAQGELSRLAAADLVYRSSSELHETLNLRTGVPMGLYMKIYRNFTGAEVMSIDQTSSLLAPVAVTIRYDYDLIGTTMHIMSDKTSKAKSQKDTDYSVVSRFFVTRRYLCDTDGFVVGDLPPLLSRAQYWPHGKQLSSQNRDMTALEAPDAGAAASASGAQSGRLLGPSFPTGNLPVVPKTPPPGAVDN